MTQGILLIHGYSGSPESLAPLGAALREALPDTPVVLLTLPGHGEAETPAFDQARFRQAIRAAAAPFDRLVVVGHSTGGTLALEADLHPLLLVLAGTPRRLEPGDGQRWEAHRAGRTPLPFLEVARLVQAIQRMGRGRLEGPVLTLQGEADDLVDPRTRWEGSDLRRIQVPGGTHDLFRDAAAPFALDAVVRAVGEALGEAPLDRNPSTLRLRGQSPGFPLEPSWEPLFANIEITTRCHLACPHCARARFSRPGEDMPLERFERILDLLPRARRITLVGLGETLLHPGLEALIAAAKARHRHIGIVTSGQFLTPERGAALVEAGLDAVAFSLDAVDPALVQRVRPGSDLQAILAHIRAFGAICRATRPVSRAVFSAVSLDTAPHLEALAEVVTTLDVQAWMLSDLNFAANQDRALWNHTDDNLRRVITRAIKGAFSKGIPALTVRGLEALDLAHTYRDHLLVPPNPLFERSGSHAHCHSPWQTLPIAINGDVTLCDCQPEAVVGNLFRDPFTPLWQKGWAEHRSRMLQEPPEVCLGCPRF